MKKIGNFFFTFLPCLLCIGLQLLAMSFVVGIEILQLLYTKSTSGSLSDFLNQLNDILTSDTFLSLSTIFYGVIATIVFGFWYCKKYVAPRTQRIPFRALTHPMMILAIPFLAFGLQYLCNYLVTLRGYLEPSWLHQYESLIDTAGLNNPSPLLFAYAVFAAPLNEELAFRGVTLSHARQHMPFWFANTLQALMFGLLHMNIIQGTYAFLIGLFLGSICAYGGSIFFSMLFHICFNLLGTVHIDLTQIFGNGTFGELSIFVLSILFTGIGMLFYHIGLTKRPYALQAEHQSSNY